MENTEKISSAEKRKSIPVAKILAYVVQIVYTVFLFLPALQDPSRTGGNIADRSLVFSADKGEKVDFRTCRIEGGSLSFLVYGLLQAGAQLFVQQRRVAFLLPQGIAQGRQFRMAGGFPHDPGMAKRLFFQLDDTAGDQHFPYVEDIADIADASPGHHEPRFGPAHDAVARQADPG